MLMLKLSRVGKKNQPSYRLVVVEKSKDPWGKYLEIVGFYNPKSAARITELKNDRIAHWLSKGAQPSATVHNLLVDAGLIKGKKVRATSPKKKEGEKTPAAAPAPAVAEAPKAA